ncbi:c-type cytochrome [Methylocystis sp. S23]|jgi:cytochrome c
MVRFAPLPLFSCLAAFILSSPAAAAGKDAIKRGAAIAKVNCGHCHAIGRAGESPNPKSPPFRYLARKYPLHNLEEALGEGIVVGHEGLEMPQFRFGAKEVEALLAYLGSIQKP